MIAIYKKLKKKIKVPINLEMASTNEMLNVAKKFKPNFVCLIQTKFCLFSSRKA